MHNLPVETDAADGRPAPWWPTHISAWSSDHYQSDLTLGKLAAGNPASTVQDPAEHAAAAMAALDLVGFEAGQQGWAKGLLSPNFDTVAFEHWNTLSTSMSGFAEANK